MATSSGEEREGYVDTLRVVLDDDMRNQALDEALRFLNGLRKRYESLSELAPVWQALDEVAPAAKAA